MVGLKNKTTRRKD